MSKQNYFLATSVVFAIVAAVHLIRAIQGWDVTIGEWEIPMWASWVAVVVAGYLAYHAHQFGGKA